MFARAVKLDASSVNANYLYGYYLTLEKRFNEAVPFFQKAVQLSAERTIFKGQINWRTIESQTDKTDEQKKIELEHAISRHLAQTKNSPEALLAAWGKYRDLTGWKDEAKPEDLKKRDYFEKQILEKYPNTKYDEEIAFTQIRSLFGKHFAKDENSKYLEIILKRTSKRTPDEVKFFEQYQARNKVYKNEQTAMQRGFLKRAIHYDFNKIRRNSTKSFSQLATEAESADEELSALLKGALENNKNYYGNLNSQIANLLVSRQEKNPASLIAKDAEKYARLGIEEAEKKVKDLPKDAKSAKIYELRLEAVNVLANILIIQEKLDEAEKLLTQSLRDEGRFGRVLKFRFRLRQYLH